MPDKSQRTRFIIYGCLAVPLLGILAWRYLNAESLGGTIEQERDLATKVGMPVGGDGMRTATALPAGENAAAIYKKAFSELLLSKVNDAHEVVPPLKNLARGQATDRDRQILKQALARGGPALAVLLKASEMKGVDFQRQWEDGVVFTQPELGPAKGGIRLLCASAIIADEAGNRQLALSRLRSAERVAYHFGSEPTVASALLRFYGEALVLDCYQSLANKTSKTTAALDEIQTAVAGLPPLPSPRMMLAGQTVITQAMVERITLEEAYPFTGGQGADADKARKLLKDPGYRKAWAAKNLFYNRQAFESLPKDSSNTQQIRSAFLQLDKAVAKDESPENFLNNLVTPQFSGVGDAFARMIAQRRTLLAGLMLLRMRARGEAIPASLPEGDDTLSDPFTNKPLTLKVDGKTFMVYSFGEDLADDHGRERPHPTTRRFDLVRTFKAG